MVALLVLIAMHLDTYWYNTNRDNLVKRIKFWNVKNILKRQAQIFQIEEEKKTCTKRCQIHDNTSRRKMLLWMFTQGNCEIIIFSGNMAVAMNSLLRPNFSQYQVKRQLWRNYALKTGGIFGRDNTNTSSERKESWLESVQISAASTRQERPTTSLGMRSCALWFLSRHICTFNFDVYICTLYHIYLFCVLYTFYIC